MAGTCGDRRMYPIGAKRKGERVKLKMKKIIFSAIFIFLWIQTGYAHHLWVIREDGRFIVACGHISDKTEAYDPECVKAVNAFDSKGNRVSLERTDDQGRAIFSSEKAEKDVSMMTVRCDWGFRVNTTKGKKLISREAAQQAGLNVINAFFSTQFSKSLFENSEGITKPAGLKFEIIPLKNPFQLAPEELLPVQILFDEKPLADISVSSQGESQAIKTDKNGIALIKIGGKGIRLISARHKDPAQNNPEMDYHLFTAFLIF